MEIKYTKNKLGFPGKNVWLIYIFKFRNYIFKPFFLVKLIIFSKNLIRPKNLMNQTSKAALSMPLFKYSKTNVYSSQLGQNAYYCKYADYQNILCFRWLLRSLWNIKFSQTKRIQHNRNWTESHCCRSKHWM